MSVHAHRPKCYKIVISKLKNISGLIDQKLSEISKKYCNSLSVL